MVNNFRGWFKIYLFYGAAFFLLGLFGSLASDQVRITAWSDKQREKLAGLWSQYIAGNEGPSIPAITKNAGKVILQVYQPEEVQSQESRAFESLIQELQRQLKNQFQEVLIMPVEDFHTVPIESSAFSETSVLIGFGKSQDKTGNEGLAENRFYFGIPEPAGALLAGKLFQTATERFPTFRFSKQSDFPNTVYELDWSEPRGDERTGNAEQAFFGVFMKLIAQDVLPLLGKPKLE